MSAVRCVLGIDQGTTGSRALVMSADGRVLATAYRAHQQHLPAPGHVEHDALEIWDCVRDVVRAACAQLPPGAHVEALGLANQGETVLAWDRVSGEPLHRALVWQDTRTQGLVDALAGDAGFAQHVEAVTGLRLDPYFSAPKMRWLLDEVPAVAAAAAAGRLALGTLDAWLLWKMTDGERFVTDPSTAARTLCFDIHRGDYDERILGRFGIPRAALPEVVASDGLLGHAAFPEAGLAAVPVRASVVDQPAALLGHGCLSRGDLKATYGTGCFVYLHTGEAPSVSRHGLLSTVVWRRGGKTEYALDGGIFAAGSVVTWLRDRLGLFSDERQLDELLLGGRAGGAGAGGAASAPASAGGAASVPASAGGAGAVPAAAGGAGAVPASPLVCLPALAGLAAPHWRRSARGVALGLDLATDRRDLVAAALEGVCWQVVDVVRAMAADSGLTLTRLRADGGLTRSVAFMQLQADCLGLPVEVSHEAEATALGVCYLAARSAGIWADDAEIHARVGVGRTYTPQVPPAEREAREGRYRRALDVAREWQG